jgi:hypothetical protein
MNLLIDYRPIDSRIVIELSRVLFISVLFPPSRLLRRVDIACADRSMCGSFWSVIKLQLSLSATDVPLSSAGSSWGRVPRVIWLGLEDSYGLQQLLKLHEALGSACVSAGLSADRRPFCAHITLGKTRDTERMSTPERRTLRGFGKWLQDEERPVGLQQLLEGDASGKGGRRGTRSLNKAQLNTKKRGNKRHKSWIAGGGHAKMERDLGALNAELALEAGPGGDAGDPRKVEIGVEAVHVMEAVREPGSKYTSYDTLLEIPLASRPTAAAGPGARPPLPAPEQRDAVARAEVEGKQVLAVELGDDEAVAMDSISGEHLSASERASLAEFLAEEDEL